MLPLILLLLLSQTAQADVGGVAFMGLSGTDQSMRAIVIVPDFLSERDARAWARAVESIEPARRALNKKLTLYTHFSQTHYRKNGETQYHVPNIRWIQAIEYNHIQSKYCKAALDELYGMKDKAQQVGSLIEWGVIPCKNSGRL